MLDHVYKSCHKADEHFILIGVRPQRDQSGAQRLLRGVAEALENLIKFDPDAVILTYSKANEKHLKPMEYLGRKIERSVADRFQLPHQVLNSIRRHAS